jgi:hypothetical protein
VRGVVHGVRIGGLGLAFQSTAAALAGQSGSGRMAALHCLQRRGSQSAPSGLSLTGASRGRTSWADPGCCRRSSH